MKNRKVYSVGSSLER